MIVDKLGAGIVVLLAFQTPRKIESSEVGGNFCPKEHRSNDQDIGKINFKTLKGKQFELQKIIEGDMPIIVTQTKYSNINGIHHYEDTNNAYTNGNVYLMSSAAFGNFSSGDVIINNTDSGTGFISTKVSSSNIIITVSTGGFNSGDQIKLNSNTQVTANIISTTTISGTPVTNYVYEDIVNEAKRKIKILKLVYVDPVVKDFKKNLEF